MLLARYGRSIFERSPLTLVCLLWLFAAMMVIGNVRLQQAKRSGEARANLPELTPKTVMFFRVSEWALFVVAMLMDWKVGLLVVACLFILKGSGALGAVGSLIVRIFAKR